MLWSDPNPQGITPAQATMHSQINPINMSAVVSAIIEHQRMQQAQQQQYQRDIQQGLQAYQQYQQQGQADDAANRAMYMAQNPNDPYTGQANYDDRVPDYGGVAQMRANQAEQQLQGGTPAQQALTLAKIAGALRAGRGGALTANADATAGRNAARSIRQDLQEEFNANPSDFNNVTTGDYDANGNWVPSPDGKYSMIGSQHTTTVKGTPASNGAFGLGAILPSSVGSYLGAHGATPDKQVPVDYSNVFPTDQVTQGKLMAQRYQQLSQSGGLSNGQGQSQYQEGATYFSPSTGKQYKVINGIPTVISNQ